MQKLLFCLIGTAVLYAHAEQEATDSFFYFDVPDEIIRTEVLEHPLFYDAGIAAATNGLWVTWLEFVPGKGDQLWVGLRKNATWASRQLLTEQPGDYANPRLTVDGQQRLWLTYEASTPTKTNLNWNIFQSYLQPNGTFTTPSRISVGESQINHSTTPIPSGGIAVISQQKQLRDNREHFRSKITLLKTNSTSDHTLATAGDHWHPSIASIADRNFYQVWDEYDGESFNVLLSAVDLNSPAQPKRDKSKAYSLAASSSFEAHAKIVSDQREKLWVIWEEDGENWGKHYISRNPGDKTSTRMADKAGPLHRFRKLHFAEVDVRKETLKTIELPQASFELARNRTNAPAGMHNFGAFYERAQLAVDGQNRPWIVYRHLYTPSFGVLPGTHKQENARIYARCLLPAGWSKLFSFPDGQGDGMQRISVAPLPDGIAVAYTFGRTDRRKGKTNQTGVVLAEIRLPKDAKAALPTQMVEQKLQPASITQAGLKNRPSTEIAGKKYELFFGDLHRHTDISLCFSPVDGTIEDAYRYAIHAAPLDFLGITDHTHDLDMGDALALIWQRSRKEVDRHALAGRFIPFYSYERSRGDTDHNVISLRGNMLRPHTYPLPKFWEELDSDTFTIPHEPFNRVLWQHKDDARRPLLEIYQGFRNMANEDAAFEGLRRGHHVGFIASSDHLSTSASFAAVWAEEPTRESVFRAMQARRTYGATAKILLKVTCGNFWMGEKFEAKKMPPIRIEATPTAKVEKLDLFINGAVAKSVNVDSRAGEKFSYEWMPDNSLAGPQIFHVRITQTDGNRAWSSPLWADIQK